MDNVEKIARVFILVVLSVGIIFGAGVIPHNDDSTMEVVYEGEVVELQIKRRHSIWIPKEERRAVLTIKSTQK